MEILISVLFFLVMIVFLRTRKFFVSKDLNPWILPLAFILKCGIGLLFLQFYIFQHTEPHLKNDAGAFFNEAQILDKVYHLSSTDYLKLMSGIGDSEALSEKYLGETNHWDSGKQAIFHDNRNIIRVHAMMLLVSFGSITVHMLFFSFLSLIGTFLLFLALKKHSALKPWVIFALLLLLPNILFWSSGILKEPIIILGIGAMAYGVTGAKSTSRRVLFIVIGLICLLSFKPYIFLALLGGGLIYIIYTRVPKHKLAWSLGIPIVLLALFILCFPSILQKGTHLLSRKQFDFSNVGRGGMHVRSEPDSVFYYFSPEQYDHLTVSGDSVWLKYEIDACKVKLGDLIPPAPIHLTPNKEPWLLHFDQPRANSFIEISPIDDNPFRLITLAPEAIFNAVFRPLLNDPGGKLKYLAFLETILLFGLIIWTIARHRTLSKNERGFILSTIVFCLLLALLIGWTTPVLGAIHRYRFPIQLALLCCIIVAWKPNIQFFKHE